MTMETAMDRLKLVLATEKMVHVPGDCKRITFRCFLNLSKEFLFDESISIKKSGRIIRFIVAAVYADAVKDT